MADSGQERPVSSAWQELRRKNRAENEAREREARTATMSFFYMLPVMPAVAILAYSDQRYVDVVADIGFLEAAREYVGPLFVAYGVVAAYLVLIGILQVLFYLRLAPLVRLAVAWVAWGWFYYSTLWLEDLKLAFLVMVVVSAFVLRIFGFLAFCYEKMREGMFLKRGGRGP